MLRKRHISPEFDENGFHSELSLPLHQARQFGWINLSIPLVYTREVDLGNEGYFRRYVWILRATMNLQAVDSVFMNAMRRTQDGTIPIRHQQIITIIETIRASLGSEPFLSFL